MNSYQCFSICATYVLTTLIPIPPDLQQSLTSNVQCSCNLVGWEGEDGQGVRELQHGQDQYLVGGGQQFCQYPQRCVVTDRHNVMTRPAVGDGLHETCKHSVFQHQASLSTVLPNVGKTQKTRPQIVCTTITIIVSPSRIIHSSA